MPRDEKPREKLMAFGPSRLTVAELVTVLLGVGTKKEEVMTMANRILREYGEKTLINETNPHKLADVLDIPIGKACQLIAGFELGRRFYLSQSGRAVYIRNAKQAFQHLRDMGTLKKEQFRGLYLNSRYQIIHDELISVGTLTANIVHPREVFAPALEYGAAALIIAHNHPSGDLEPSNADVEVTAQLQAAGQLLGIDLLDHLIINDRTFISILKEGKS
jgi:DNA repair protein RadC